MKDTHARSLTKAISWRVIGTLDTIGLSLLITGELTTALAIGLTEVVTKIVLYYVHERIWNRVRWGRMNSKVAHYRSIVKTLTWRITGTADTTLLAYFYSRDWTQSLSIGGLELITKMILYYLHERIWQVIKWGRIWETRD